jgi:hypothetical protein
MDVKDKTVLSVPENLKFEVAGRNANARRVPLGRKLKLLRFYSSLVGPVAGGVTIDEAGKPVVPWSSLFGKLPELLDAVGTEYEQVIKDCTDLDMEWVEQNCGVEDLYTIMQKVFEVNQLGDAVTKVIGGGKDDKKKAK